MERLSVLDQRDSRIDLEIVLAELMDGFKVTLCLADLAVAAFLLPSFKFWKRAMNAHKENIEIS